jgi:hypothetical protein
VVGFGNIREHPSNANVAKLPVLMDRTKYRAPSTSLGAFECLPGDYRFGW